MKEKFLKGLATLVLSMCMAFLVFTTASAEESYGDVGLELKTEQQGSKLTATVTITDNFVNFKDIQTKITFNKKVLDLVEIKDGDTGLKLRYNKNPEEKGFINVVGTKEKGFTDKGLLFTAEFKVKDRKNVDGAVKIDAEKTKVDVEASITVKGELVIHEGWVEDANGKYYQYEDGTYAKDWTVIEGKWYYFDKSTGYMKTGWLLNGGTWYYLNEDGTMATGWTYIDGYWYYMYSNGHMATGWTNVGGYWYYMNGSGQMLTGWMSVGGYWYYMYSDGHMATEWVNVGGYWYYMDGSGHMLTGWTYVGGYWYYMYSDGHMATGWAYVGGYWYYMNSSGHMLTGWVWIGGKCYYFYSDGHMAVSTYVGSYYVDASGAWVY